jgi:hypothetical protein
MRHAKGQVLGHGSFYARLVIQGEELCISRTDALLRNPFSPRAVRFFLARIGWCAQECCNSANENNFGDTLAAEYFRHGSPPELYPRRTALRPPDVIRTLSTPALGGNL